MADREVMLGGTRWNVSLLAERLPRAGAWRLVLGFRPPESRRAQVWAAYPREFSSRAALYAKAERLSDQALADVLAERLS